MRSAHPQSRVGYAAGNDVQDSGMNVAQGRLWVVATPIGNLDDLSPRAADVLRTVGLIAAEDTRHSALLLARVGSRAP